MEHKKFHYKRVHSIKMSMMVFFLCVVAGQHIVQASVLDCGPLWRVYAWLVEIFCWLVEKTLVQATFGGLLVVVLVANSGPNNINFYAKYKQQQQQ
jgi:hypothetical protein